ncbi:unnamed protein product [Merluccius merluccius]
MVSRRERMKHSLCDLQEKIFHLHIQLLEDEVAGEKTQKGEKRRQNGVKEKGKGRRRSPEKKKERWKSGNSTLLKELGLSKSFPLDNSLFDSWLAQSVQITADDMLSRWALSSQHQDKSASLLSDQLLQGEESLLNLMMENSMQSAWKTPQLGRKPRSRSLPRPAAAPTLSQSPRSATAPSATATAAATGLPAAESPRGAAVGEEKPSPGRRGERSRSASSKTPHHLHHLHLHQSRSVEPQRDPPPQPPISKMDSCHISEEPERGPRDGPHATNGTGAGTGSTAALTPSLTAAFIPSKSSSTGAPAPSVGPLPRAALRLRLSRQSKSRGRGGGAVFVARVGSREKDTPLKAKETSSLDSAETDGYFSDGEQSDLDTRPADRKLHLSKLHSGSEDLLRRSVLAS